MPAETALELPRLRVTVDAARAAAFARETGVVPEPDIAPLAYPAVWLTAPEIYGAVRRICAEAESIPVHEQQRFRYVAPLHVGKDYDVRVVLRREITPARLNVEARIETPEGAPIALVEAKLRLVPRALLERGGGA